MRYLERMRNPYTGHIFWFLDDENSERVGKDTLNCGCCSSIEIRKDKDGYMWLGIDWEVKNKNGSKVLRTGIEVVASIETIMSNRHK